MRNEKLQWLVAVPLWALEFAHFSDFLYEKPSLLYSQRFPLFLAVLGYENKFSKIIIELLNFLRKYSRITGDFLSKHILENLPDLSRPLIDSHIFFQASWKSMKLNPKLKWWESRARANLLPLWTGFDCRLGPFGHTNRDGFARSWLNLEFDQRTTLSCSYSYCTLHQQMHNFRFFSEKWVLRKKNYLFTNDIEKNNKNIRLYSQMSSQNKKRFR